MKSWFFLSVLFSVSACAQTLDLYRMPLEGDISTQSIGVQTANIHLTGQAAKGLYERLPDTATLPAGTICEPKGMTIKRAGGVMCSRLAATGAKKTTTYSCNVTVDLNQSSLAPEQDTALCEEQTRYSDKDKAEEEKWADKVFQKAKKQGYRIDWSKE